MSHTNTSEQVVNQFLQALVVQDHQQIAALLAPDLRYTNVSLPTLVGGQRVANLFEILLRRGTGFEVKMHSVAVSGNVVLTERTDIIKVGKLHVAFWVCGRFEVRNGKIVVWRDYFDWMDISKGMLRGVLGLGIPKLRLSFAK